MTLLVTVDGDNKITKVELVASAEGLALPAGTYAYETDSETICNAVLNDYTNCVANFNTGHTAISSIAVVGASATFHARKIADANWIKRVRPALFRAATTTNLLNA